MIGTFDDSMVVSDISGWDVSAVEDMSFMFNRNTHFNIDISGWDISNVKDMSYMFSNSIFNKDISSWNVADKSDIE